jgi:hypothetical protein
MAKIKADRPPTPTREGWEEAFESAQSEGSVIEQGEWASFAAIGDHVCGILEGFIEPSAKIKRGGCQLKTPGGVVVPVGFGGNLKNLVRQDLKGRIISIWFTGEEEVGEASPMKRYAVIDHGGQWPSFATEQE